MQSVVEVASLDDGNGGLQQQRHPSLAKPRRIKRQSPEQLDLLGLGLDDSDPAIDAGPLSPLNPVVAAHGINNESAGHTNLMPGY